MRILSSETTRRATAPVSIQIDEADHENHEMLANPMFSASGVQVVRTPRHSRTATYFAAAASTNRADGPAHPETEAEAVDSPPHQLPTSSELPAPMRLADLRLNRSKSVMSDSTDGVRSLNAYSDCLDNLTYDDFLPDFLNDLPVSWRVKAWPSEQAETPDSSAPPSSPVSSPVSRTVVHRLASQYDADADYDDDEIPPLRDSLEYTHPYLDHLDHGIAGEPVSGSYLSDSHLRAHIRDVNAEWLMNADGRFVTAPNADDDWDHAYDRGQELYSTVPSETAEIYSGLEDPLTP